jgi:hypothetical protein
VIAAFVKQLRIQTRRPMLILNAPPGYIESLDGLPEGVELVEHTDGDHDFVHLLVGDSTDYALISPAASGAMKYDYLLWISYPDRSSRVAADFTRDALSRLPGAQISDRSPGSRLDARGRPREWG